MEADGLLDSKLLQAIAIDITSAFPQLVRTYHSQLYGYVINQIKNQQSAEDIMQDCWVRIYQALGQYPREKIQSLKLRSWLFTINFAHILRRQARSILSRSMSWPVV